MDKLVRKIEVPLAQKAISDAGLYIARPEDADLLAEIAMDAYREYPLHIWLTNGRYDEKASKKIMKITLETNKESNVSMYEHFGFCLKEKGLIPKSDVMHYAMTRQPL